MAYLFGNEELLTQPFAFEFYANLDKADILEGGQTQFVFDGAESRVLEPLLNSDIRQVYGELIPFSIFLELQNNQIPIALRNQHGWYDEANWYRIRLSEERNDFPVSIFIGSIENPDPTTLYLTVMDTVSDDLGRSLTNFTSIDGLATYRDKIARALNLKRSRRWHLSIYQVGQGNMTAICDSDTNVPLIYYDIGGGWRFNHQTYPTLRRPCFSVAKTIIVSHWDWDHLETARRIWKSGQWNTYFNRNTWIVPTNAPSISYAQFASYILASGGTIVVWPNTNYSITFWGGKLFRCTGPDKNNNGIALIVDSPTNTIQKVLHPGDASFAYIPYFITRDHVFDGIIAAHHGANFHLNNNPVPISLINPNGCIVYNYGLLGGRPTRYGHPKAAAVTAYQNAGWNCRLDTVSGSVAFRRGVNNNTVICANGQCDLAIANNF